MVGNQKDYKGFVIEPNPQELADGSGWTEGCIIKINRFEGTWRGSDREFPTRDEAIAASILAAKHMIDRSQSKLGQDADRNGIVPCGDLSATWTENENLRPTIQGDTDVLTGDHVLRYTKDKRRQRLDELDGEPE